MTVTSERLLWRVFPWDRDAGEGEQYSASWLPETQGRGRFDLRGGPGVLYLAETPEHAIAEMIQHYRGHVLEPPDLIVAERPLALVSVLVKGARIADLCDPRELLRLDVRPDETASAERAVTQRIAGHIRATGFDGLRWWSALSGDWHSVVLFRDRIVAPLEFGSPLSLTLAEPVVLDAMRALGMSGARLKLT